MNGEQGHIGVLVDLPGQRAGGRGYLALPPAGGGPGVLVLHAWWGLTGPVMALCNRLAGEDCLAVAAVGGIVLEARHTPVWDEGGAVVGVIGVATDITARVRAERAVQRFEVGLSPTEGRVLPLLARPDLRTYRQIGAELHLEGETVRGHAKAIAHKLGLATTDRAAIAATARDLGLLPEPVPPADA